MLPALTALADTAGLSLVLPALLPAFAFLAASLFFFASLTILQGRQATAPTRTPNQLFSRVDTMRNTLLDKNNRERGHTVAACGRPSGAYYRVFAACLIVAECTMRTQKLRSD